MARRVGLEAGAVDDGEFGNEIIQFRTFGAAQEVANEETMPGKLGHDTHIQTMFGIGAGEDTPALHNPDYDFPDDIIPAGIAVFERIIRQAD